MMLIKNIGFLAQIDDAVNQSGSRSGTEMEQMPVLENAWLTIENGLIADYGTMDTCTETYAGAMIDAQGGAVLPTWCDSHTHLVFAAPREGEFVDKILGKSYADIAAKGGGILNSAEKMALIDEDELFEISLVKLKKLIALGTGAIEIKSGYGLTMEAELKMLRVIRRLKNLDLIPVKATFLGAHALPAAYKNNKAGYIDLVIHEILPKVVEADLADYIDVFCEDGFFDRKDTERIIQAGAAYGLKAKIHANQLNLSGGVQVGVANGALSVDHLETMGAEEIKALQRGQTIPTLLPGAAFFLRMQYPPARDLINAGLPVTVASDYNPGSCPSGNMNLMLSLACIQMRMTPNEAITAQTINGAAAMELSATHGSITKGKVGSVIITKPVSSLAYLPYSYGENWIAQVIIAGKEVM